MGFIRARRSSRGLSELSNLRLNDVCLNFSPHHGQFSRGIGAGSQPPNDQTAVVTRAAFSAYRTSSALWTSVWGVSVTWYCARPRE